MPALQGIVTKAYWTLAGLGGLWALLIALLTNPTIQRHALYAHKLHSGFWHNVSRPEEFGFAKGQVQPFWLDTTDGENLFCWHVIPLDVYAENEHELATAATAGEVVGELKGTVGEKLLRRDPDARVVVNFHGNAGHVGQGHRPSTYRSISGVPHTHLLTCDYRGFGYSTLKNPPHIPTETGLITDSTSLVSYIFNDLKHPSTRTVLLGQSLGTAVAAATALYFANPDSSTLPTDMIHTQPKPPPKSFPGFAGIVLVAPFTNLAELLKTYAVAGVFPILKPLQPYPRLAGWVTACIVDHWPTVHRLRALLVAPSSNTLHVSILHARNDADITFRQSEALFAPLRVAMLAEDGASATEERRSIHGQDGVRRGAFAYQKVEDAKGWKTIEMEIVGFGGHDEIVGWSQVSLAVRRAFGRKIGNMDLDIE